MDIPMDASPLLKCLNLYKTLHRNARNPSFLSTARKIGGAVRPPRGVKFNPLNFSGSYLTQDPVGPFK
ncbi:hypothetical protein [Desulfococcus sp.]|uniref:hypothetical protein n=1 Tax=Desulfococcus sp. TaxID=2025834 RepID=UPI0035935DE6